MWGRSSAVDDRNSTCEAPVSEMRGDRDVEKVSIRLALKREQDDRKFAACVGGS